MIPTAKIIKRLNSPEDYDRCYKELLQKWNRKKNNGINIKYTKVVDELIEGLSTFRTRNIHLEKYDLLDSKFAEEYCFIDKYCIQHDLTYDNLLIHKREVALKYLLQNNKQFSDCEFWTSLKSAYILLSGAKEIIPKLKNLFTTRKGTRNCLMTESERSYLKGLPDEVQIYRGMSFQEAKSKNYGVSWTLDETVAEFFAYKHPDKYMSNDEKTVVSKVIPKSEIIAYFEDRKEKEIIWVNK